MIVVEAASSVKQTLKEWYKDVVGQQRVSRVGVSKVTETGSWRGVLVRQEETLHWNGCSLHDGSLCSQLQLVASNTFCQHMEIHK